MHTKINEEAFPNAINLYDKEKMVGRGRGKYRYKNELVEEGKELKDSDEIYFDIDYIDRYSEEIGTDDKFVKNLCDRLFRQYMKTDVSKRFNKEHSKAEYRPVVSNLLLMLKQKDYTFDKFKQDYSSRFDKNIAKKQIRIILIIILIIILVIILVI